ncbi:hypothetical protein SAMN05216324_1371, partial [Chryseobacterium limigenitum]
MKKIFVLLGILSLASLYRAQVGVNTENPAATFDVVAKTTGTATTTPEGLITPRL